MTALLIVGAVCATVIAWRKYAYWCEEDIGFGITQSVLLFGKNAKAARERDKKAHRYFREYLLYGFDTRTSRRMANERMAKEAKAANEVKV